MEANWVIHLFLYDHDNTRILSFCGGLPLSVMTPQDVWSQNKKAILDYVPKNKELKLIWEDDPKTQRIIESLRPLSDVATEAFMSFSFGGAKKDIPSAEHLEQQHSAISGAGKTYRILP